MITILSLVNSIWNDKIDFYQKLSFKIFSVLSLHAICKRKKNLPKSLFYYSQTRWYLLPQWHFYSREFVHYFLVYGFPETRMVWEASCHTWPIYYSSSKYYWGIIIMQVPTQGSKAQLNGKTVKSSVCNNSAQLSVQQ